MAKLQPKLQTCSSSIQEIHLGHLAGLDAVDDVDVGLHRFVVGVAGPFHHDVGRDAAGEGLDDEGLASGVGTDQGPFRMDFIKTDAALVCGDAYRFVDTGHLAELLEFAVHRLVGVLGKDTVVLHRDSPVFLQKAPGHIVDFNLYAVGGLDGGDLQMVGFDIGPAQGLGIREPEAGLISGIFRLSNHRSPIFTENAPDTLRGIFRGDKQIFRRTPKA